MVAGRTGVVDCQPSAVDDQSCAGSVFSEGCASSTFSKDQDPGRNCPIDDPDAPCF